MDVLVFGNALVEADGLAGRVADALAGEIPGVTFRKVESLTEFIGCCSDERLMKHAPVVLDVAEGIEQVEVIEDEKRLQSVKAVSAHDLDMAFELKLFKKTGDVKEFRVIAIPAGYPLEKAVSEVRKKIEAIK